MVHYQNSHYSSLSGLSELIQPEGFRLDNTSSHKDLSFNPMVILGLVEYSGLHTNVLA